MSENTTPEITDEGMPEGMTAEQRAELLTKVKAFAAKPAAIATTESGSEAVGPAGPVSDGANVDWSMYDIPFALRHHYPKAKYRETPDGPKWVVMIDEFFSMTRDFNNHGKRIKNDTEYLNLGEFLSEKLNDGDGWRVVSLLPTIGGQVGMLLQRQVPYGLPDPQMLKTDKEVAPPTDPELAQAEDAALTFMADEGLSAQLVEEAEQQSKNRLVEEAVALNPTPTLRDPGSLLHPRKETTDIDFLGEVADKAEAVIQGEDFNTFLFPVEETEGEGEDSTS